MPLEIPLFDRRSTPKLDYMDGLAAQLQAKFGPAILYRLSKALPKVEATALSTGSLGLDRATDIGGVPRGRFSVYQGGDSSGKTTMAYHLLAEAQRDGGLAALIDGEGASDPMSMRGCGVDLDDLILASPRDAVEALEMVEILVRCRGLDAIVTTALPDASRILSQRLRRLNVWLPESPTAVTFARLVGQRAPSDALSFYASLIVSFQQQRPIFGPGGDLEGFRVQAVVSKNKMSAPGGVAELDVLRGSGIDRAAELVALGESLGVIERHRLGLVFGRLVLGKNAAAARRELASDPELTQELRAEIRTRMQEQ